MKPTGRKYPHSPPLALSLLSNWPLPCWTCPSSTLRSSQGLYLKADHARLQAFQINQQSNFNKLRTKGESNVAKELACARFSQSHTSNNQAFTCSRSNEYDHQQDSSNLQKDALLQEGFSDDVSYGTRHVIVLADFLPSITTTDLEKMLVRFKDHGVVIHWLNDTIALVVVRLPSVEPKLGKEGMENYCRQGNWTEEVEDLVHGGEIDKAITLLEAAISKLEKKISPESTSRSQSSSELATALLDLSKLYSSQGLSLKADHARLRAFQINQQSNFNELLTKGESNVAKESACARFSHSHNSNNQASTCSRSTEYDHQQDSSNLQKDGLLREGFSDDDWEAAADRAPDELLSPLSLSGVSKLLLEDAQVQNTKGRGRGTFSYKKRGMYSDEQVVSDAEDKTDPSSPAGEMSYGTRHVLVLADFPPSTTTTDLEKLLERFKDHGVVIHWLNDTTALAVFRSPSVALEASMCIKCPFTIRVLDDSDELLRLIPQRDLEPPHLRPKTSARTAQRLIAQSMGIKLSSTTFGSEELRKQEAARRDRIVTRQHMKDDAWGDLP